MFGKRIDRPGGSRRAVRETAMIPAAIMTVTDSLTVDLLDMSTTGACIRGADLPSPGQEVLILIGRLEAFGSVVWRDQDRCGIRFDVALSESALAIVESERGPCTVLASGADSPFAAADWNNGLAR